jgi:signal transduction histidine kinase
VITAVESPYRVLSLSGGDAPDWFTGICRQLSYEQVSLKRLNGNLRSALQKLEADAIVAHYERGIAKTFRAIIETLPLPHRPILVFILHDDVPNAPADLLLPPFHFAVQQSVGMALKQRAEQLALLRDCEYLRGEIQTANQRLEEHRQIGDELTLLKNALVRNVSHELKTPLLHVKSAVALLAEENEASNLAGYATEAVARLETVVKNITQLADGLDIHLAPVLIHEAVDQAMRSLRRSWQHKNKLDRIAIEVGHSLPPVLADKQGLGIIFFQLLDNALKFSQDRVEVTAYKLGGLVSISIRDYGIGIPKDKSEKIFESFYQVESTSTRRFGGTGVGLAIVRLILERHQSSIHVESEEGRGSTFTFKLPIADVKS